MDNPIRSTVTQGSFRQPPVLATVPEEDLSSGVSWAAVLGGAFVIAGLSFALLALGSGLGFASVSPWPNEGASATTIGFAAIAWLIVMQLVASGMGGYLAGRLRTKWARIHTDEVFFRDTAHGFLSWAVAAVVTGAFLVTAATLMSSAATAGTTAGAATAVASGPASENDYYIDSMFRSPNPEALASVLPANVEVRNAEASRLFAHALANPDTSAADQVYLAKLVAIRAGIGEDAAQQRVSSALAQAREAMDTARKAAAHTSIWSFVALLVGAFSASYAATIGGRQRDQVVAI